MNTFFHEYFNEETCQVEDLKVRYYYQPAEAPTREYPGCCESVEVQSITNKNGEDYEARLSESEMQELEADCLHHANQLLSPSYDY